MGDWFDKGLHVEGIDLSASDLNRAVELWRKRRDLTYLSLQSAVLNCFPESVPVEVSCGRIADRMLQKLKASGHIRYLKGAGRKWEFV